MLFKTLRTILFLLYFGFTPKLYPNLQLIMCGLLTDTNETLKVKEEKVAKAVGWLIRSHCPRPFCFLNSMQMDQILSYVMGSCAIRHSWGGGGGGERVK